MFAQYLTIIGNDTQILRYDANYNFIYEKRLNIIFKRSYRFRCVKRSYTMRLLIIGGTPIIKECKINV